MLACGSIGHYLAHVPMQLVRCFAHSQRLQDRKLSTASIFVNKLNCVWASNAEGRPVIQAVIGPQIQCVWPDSVRLTFDSVCLTLIQCVGGVLDPGSAGRYHNSN